jgi:hypothetical protein
MNWRPTMMLPLQARPVARRSTRQTFSGGVTPSDCCGDGKCCIGACLFGSCAGYCVPNFGQC